MFRLESPSRRRQVLCASVSGAWSAVGWTTRTVCESSTQQHEQMFVSSALFTHGDACILSSDKDDEEQVRRHSLVRTRTFFIVQFNVQHAGRQKITTRSTSAKTKIKTRT
ncbi:hypothetical protein J6590_101284 [Homalodisca vitripennis]|nr:hypothetical protein J6590_101284 [Homalodisca vitripennis]